MRVVYWIILGLVTFSYSCSTLTQKKVSEEYIDDFHESILTVDSHTDTPLRFTREGFDFGERQSPKRGGSKIDLPRMKEGKLDGVFMAVFLGQRETTDEGYLNAKMKAYQIFDSIYSVINRYNEDLRLATNPGEFRRNDSEGKHSIFIGLENGYPIGMDVTMVDSFYNLGARYITLCHTKNNQLCDSSTDPDGPEHNGLSPLGIDVVKRMNELGMMVDVSHISDKSFYDVLEVTSKPVIASHSCARAICDNPRNLDDEMLKTLAKNGGVIQMCILSAYVEEPVPNPQRDSAKNAVYEKHGDYYELDETAKGAFLEDWYKVDEIFPPKLANVRKVVDHIDHIVTVAGIDHVGIGTDFDGGGGVEGCYDVSEIKNITAELLRRGYSEKDIRKIWSGNLLRVMDKQG
ncbi:MAG: dipeptidase [Bacteroidales bacterium]